MEQCSHQILWSGFAFSAFVICHDPDGFQGVGRRLLQSEDNRTRVIRLVSAFVDGARQDERCGRCSLSAMGAITMIDSKQNR
jgi:hypothetical protein